MPIVVKHAFYDVPILLVPDFPARGTGVLNGKPPFVVSFAKGACLHTGWRSEVSDVRNQGVPQIYTVACARMAVNVV